MDAFADWEEHWRQGRGGVGDEGGGGRGGEGRNVWSGQQARRLLQALGVKPFDQMYLSKCVPLMLPREWKNAPFVRPRPDAWAVPLRLEEFGGEDDNDDDDREEEENEDEDGDEGKGGEGKGERYGGGKKAQNLEKGGGAAKEGEWQPSRAWIRAFWREVDITARPMQLLYSDWPLVPLALEEPEAGGGDGDGDGEPAAGGGGVQPELCSVGMFDVVFVPEDE